MGRLRFELRTNRLKAECSTAELATQVPVWAELKVSRSTPLNPCPLSTGQGKTLQSVAKYTHFSPAPPPSIRGGELKWDAAANLRVQNREVRKQLLCHTGSGQTP